jgi:hypothetical protein
MVTMPMISFFASNLTVNILILISNCLPVHKTTVNLIKNTSIDKTGLRHGLPEATFVKAYLAGKRQR